MFASQGQAQAFLATVYAGLAAGVAYDLLRLFRLCARAGPMLTGILDFVFWGVAAALVSLAAALAGAPGLRFYLVLGTGCGMLLWAAGLRRMMAGAAAAAQKMLKRWGKGAIETAPGQERERGRENTI